MRWCPDVSAVVMCLLRFDDITHRVCLVIKIYLVSVSNYSRSVLIHVVCCSSN